MPDGIGEKIAYKKLNLSPKKKYILFAGLIRKYKGLDLLIDAFKKISKEIPELELLIAGEFYDDKRKYWQNWRGHHYNHLKKDIFLDIMSFLSAKPC